MSDIELTPVKALLRETSTQIVPSVSFVGNRMTDPSTGIGKRP